MIGYYHFSSPLIRLQKITGSTGIYHMARPINFRSETYTPNFDKRSQFHSVQTSTATMGAAYTACARNGIAGQVANHNSKLNNDNFSVLSIRANGSVA